MFSKISNNTFSKNLKNYIKFNWYISSASRKEHIKDSKGIPDYDPGIEIAINEGISWLMRAQDNSSSDDGGVASHYSLNNGWSSSYPETTGYIIPTLIEYSKSTNDKTIHARVKRMLDWLVSIQFSEGCFQGGIIGDVNFIPNTFNTGQILLGLVAGVKKFGNKYHESMLKAADWLVMTQDSDGCWRNYPSHLVKSSEKTYETHVAWGLLEVARYTGESKYEEAALKNIWWALKFQEENGWFNNCSFGDHSQPLTHTLGYAFRGILEAYQYSGNSEIYSACEKTADGLLTAISSNGFLPGRLRSDWSGSVSWVCLTGSVQIAYCLLKLHQIKNNIHYRDAAYALNQYVRRTMNTNGPLEIKGAIKGSFPIYGDYTQYSYISWACKFYIDSNMLEKTIKKQT